MRSARPNPLPLSAGQVRSLALAAGRELSWGLPRVRRAERRWEAMAEEIPDGAIREAALSSLRRKRGNVVGAALFATLPPRRNAALLDTLATFQTIFDFLDNINERHTPASNGRQLHQALVDAFEPGRPQGDYYAHSPWREDGDYLQTLVAHCRRRCAELPSYERVRPSLVREAVKAQQVLALNHIPDPLERDRALRRWAEAEAPEDGEWEWFELAAAASGQLAIFALLALAAEAGLDDRRVERTYETYWPLVPLTATMLDSFVDQSEDLDSGDHLYVAHYGDDDRALNRMSELIELACGEMAGLPHGHRHTVVLGCMVTFYLTKQSALTGGMKPQSRHLIESGGSLAQLLSPVLRAWRFAYAQSSA